MTYGRSVEKSLKAFNIDVATWPQLAQDRAAWRGAIHGSQLVSSRPKRAAAARADSLIDVAIADARASINDIDAAILTFARARAAAPSAPPPVQPVPAPQPAPRRGRRAPPRVVRAFIPYTGPLNAAQM